jgi:hypothetical protein
MTLFNLPFLLCMHEEKKAHLQNVGVRPKGKMLEKSCFQKNPAPLDGDSDPAIC